MKKWILIACTGFLFSCSGIDEQFAEVDETLLVTRTEKEKDLECPPHSWRESGMDFKVCMKCGITSKNGDNEEVNAGEEVPGAMGGVTIGSTTYYSSDTHFIELSNGSHIIGVRVNFQAPLWKLSAFGDQVVIIDEEPLWETPNSYFLVAEETDILHEGYPEGLGPFSGTGTVPGQNIYLIVTPNPETRSRCISMRVSHEGYYVGHNSGSHMWKLPETIEFFFTQRSSDKLGGQYFMDYGEGSGIGGVPIGPWLGGDGSGKTPVNP